MSEDILHRKQLETSDMTFDFTSESYNYTLVIIEDLCVRMENKPLQDLQATHQSFAMARDLP